MDAGEFNRRLRRCERPDECRELFRAAIAPFGLDTFVCGELDLAVRERKAIYIMHWPEAWRSFYLSSGFVERDPVVDALVDRREPFTWSELRADRRFEAGARALGLASSFGWTEGLAVPLARGLNTIGLVSMVGRGEQLGRPAIDYLTLIATCLHSHVRTLLGRHGFADPPAGLTQREMDCLKLVVSGLTDAEIAASLAIAVSTAHEHVEKAKRKLCTKSRAEAAAVAVSLGVVDV